MLLVHVEDVGGVGFVVPNPPNAAPMHVSISLQGLAAQFFASAMASSS